MLTQFQAVLRLDQLHLAATTQPLVVEETEQDANDHQRDQEPDVALQQLDAILLLTAFGAALLLGVLLVGYLLLQAAQTVGVLQFALQAVHLLQGMVSLFVALHGRKNHGAVLVVVANQLTRTNLVGIATGYIQRLERFLIALGIVVLLTQIVVVLA